MHFQALYPEIPVSQQHFGLTQMSTERQEQRRVLVFLWCICLGHNDLCSYCWHQAWHHQAPSPQGQSTVHGSSSPHPKVVFSTCWHHHLALLWGGQGEPWILDLHINPDPVTSHCIERAVFGLQTDSSCFQLSSFQCMREFCFSRSPFHTINELKRCLLCGTSHQKEAIFIFSEDKQYNTSFSRVLLLMKH